MNAVDSTPSGSAAAGELPAALLANVPGMIYRCRTDPGRTLEFASTGARALLGLEPQALVQSRARYDDLICRDDRDRVQKEIREALMQRDTFSCEYRVLHADGHRRTVWEQGCAVRDHSGAVVAWEGFVTDVSLRTEAARARNDQENQTRQTNNLKSLNALARGVAHDFNNVLAGILSSAELIKMDATPENPHGEFLEHIFETGVRAREMINQLREFSQRKPGERVLIPLAPVLGECLESLRALIPETVEIAHAYAHHCPPVFADAAQVQQAVKQLCLYSWQSLPGQKGRIHVRLDTCEIEANAPAETGLRPGNYVRISILDNGGGLRKSQLDRFWEPFAFKTSGDKKSGLELFIVQQIVHEHDGEVTVESTPGKGSIFQIHFPVPA
jgi:PAS domain S-box-containing protein